jgi:hypothetical protein
VNTQTGVQTYNINAYGQTSAYQFAQGQTYQITAVQPIYKEVCSDGTTSTWTGSLQWQATPVGQGATGVLETGNGILAITTSTTGLNSNV